MSESSVRNALASADRLLVAVLDPRGAVISLSAYLERRTGVPTATLIGKPWADVLAACVDPATLPALENRFRNLCQGNAGATDQISLVLASGEERHLLCTSLANSPESSHEAGFLILGQDITERHLREEERRRNERLAAFAAACSRIAHELRNPLSSILLNAQILSADVPEASPMAGCAGDIVGGARRMEGYMNQLLAFTRPTEPHPRAFHLPQMVEEALEEIARDASDRGVRVEPPRIRQRSPRVLADPEHVRTALRNVLQNALDAMGDGGVLHVGCEPAPPRTSGDSGSVEVHVEDTGKGIPRQDLHRIFDPTFSTKPKAKGLGLTVAQALVARNDGSIRVESVPGKGTRVIVRLPALETEHDAGCADEEA